MINVVIFPKSTYAVKESWRKERDSTYCFRACALGLCNRAAHSIGTNQESSRAFRAVRNSAGGINAIAATDDNASRRVTVGTGQGAEAADGMRMNQPQHKMPVMMRGREQGMQR